MAKEAEEEEKTVMMLNHEGHNCNEGDGKQAKHY